MRKVNPASNLRPLCFVALAVVLAGCPPMVRNNPFDPESDPGKVSRPYFSLSEGTYTTVQQVTISCNTPGATIYYTTDSTSPSAASTQYTGAIAVGASMTIEAVATGTGLQDSDIVTLTLVINLPAAAPPAPSGLTATAGDGTVTLAWEAVSGANHHDVYYRAGTTAATTDATVGPFTTGTATITGLTNGTQHAFVVTATNATGEGVPSEPATATPTATIVAVTGVTLDKTTDTIPAGSTDQLSAAVAPADATNKNVTWSTSDPSVATVSVSGLVTGMAAGTTTVTVTTADGGKTAFCTVTVTIPVAGVSLDKASDVVAALAVGQLTATIAPANATNQTVTWSTSNVGVAAVSASGVVTAGSSSGTATITVTTQDGSRTASCVVTVLSLPVGQAQLDTSFGSGGVQTNTQLAAMTLALPNWALQSDGKVVYGGIQSADSFACRFDLTSNLLDSNFNGNGYRQFNTGATEWSYEVSVTPAQKVFLYGAGSDGVKTVPITIQYNSNGSLDTGYNGTGYLRDDLGFITPMNVNASAFQSDGKIVLAGVRTDRVFLVRYTSAGARDSTFGSSGVAYTLQTYEPSIPGCIVQPDGKILIMGSRKDRSPDSYAYVSRYNSNGTLDTSFGTNGEFTYGSPTVLNYVAYDAAVLTNGKILIYGYCPLVAGSTSRLFFMLLNSNGSLDATFGTGGFIYLSPGTEHGPVSVKLMPDGKVLFAFVAKIGGISKSLLGRFNSDWSYDASFGTGGFASIQIESYETGCSGFGIQSDGKIVASGRYYSGSTTYWFARFSY